MAGKPGSKIVANIAGRLTARDATKWATQYVTLIEDAGQGQTLNLYDVSGYDVSRYDVSGLAHYELKRALLEVRGSGTAELALNAFEVRAQLLRKVDAAVAYSNTDPFNVGVPWNTYDLVSFSSGLSVMASEAFSMTHDIRYRTAAQRWGADVLGANARGSSFIVGDGSTFFKLHSAPGGKHRRLSDRNDRRNARAVERGGGGAGELSIFRLRAGDAGASAERRGSLRAI